MTQLISARLPNQTAERVKQYARRKQRSLNETVTLALEEWLRQNEFPYIEFRDTPEGRIAFMKNSRLPVYDVVKIAKSYGMDLEKTMAYWPDRPKEWLQTAFNYYEAYPEEIDAQLAEDGLATYESLKRMLPQLERFQIASDPAR